jgi:glycosyltransferase involved in cell wall biosynthesis
VELIDDGGTGLHVTPDDPDDMARALRQLAESPALAERMGDQARTTYERLYSPRSTMAGQLAIYREAIACARARSNDASGAGAPPAGEAA